MARKCRVLEPGTCEITWGYKKGTHNGIDLVGANYTLQWEVAHSDGVVVAIKNDCNYNTYPKGPNIYGNYVKIRHDNGYYTLYAHIKYNTVQVKVGQRVKRGQRLGYMGNTGYSNGGHLHWEVRNTSDVTIDPTPYLDADLPTTSKVNVYYRVRTQKHGWLPIVENLKDYAGWQGSPITDVAIKVDKGSLWYQVHVKGKNWLPRVSGFNINEPINGYAGDGRPIDAIRVYYYTPEDIIKNSGYKKAKYRVNNFNWQYDDEYDKSGENYAGVFGVNATEFRIIIE